MDVILSLKDSVPNFAMVSGATPDPLSIVSVEQRFMPAITLRELEMILSLLLLMAMLSTKDLTDSARRYLFIRLSLKLPQSKL